MREIKFRAWDGEKMWYQDSKTVDGNDVSFHFFNGGIIWGVYDNRMGNRICSGEYNQLTESTCLKDKNGKEIYDRDWAKRRIHLVGGGDYMDYTCEVRWNGWCYGLFVANKQLWGLDPITARSIEVIGNIYEHPNLIK